MHGSPAKQRAALAPLDANARPSLPSPKMPKDGSVSVIPLTGGSSPLKKSLSSSLTTTTTSGTKRPAEELTPPGRKKTCVEEDARRSRTSSPDSPSLFDTSAAEGDSSWATAATEPDVGIVSDAPALLAPRQRGTMTREQAREKAAILRLRLGLASYKVRTGQTTVPLADLERKPLPRKTVRVQSPPSRKHAHASAAAAAGEPGTASPGPSSTLSKGAASGLLSLARGQS
ncbi:cyclin-dependent kinase [Metarhizium guizhouense ARSEF 977]|uniref:Cyclin-dependent kinase n=1 Tax=Metarhizium guizhouense (strain ARSEF 977) TaxID=1276136 RepID=A0A0B4I268_METGA|nr:cyclin-dependent kinase [Metarhizium guizhouense ARSEF 977]